MPTKAEILELVTFLAAHISVSKDDGQHEKAERYQALQNTVKALAERAVDLSKVTRVVVEYEGGILGHVVPVIYDDGCVTSVQDDGRTLKILPTPKPGTFI